MPKFQKFYQEMIDQNWPVFKAFTDLHDAYSLNPTQFQGQYNLSGPKVLEIIREWERKLCKHQERGQFGKFSSGLSDKFWELVRKDYPKIDFIGVKIS